MNHHDEFEAWRYATLGVRCENATYRYHLGEQNRLIAQQWRENEELKQTIENQRQVIECLKSAESGMWVQLRQADAEIKQLKEALSAAQSAPRAAVTRVTNTAPLWCRLARQNLAHKLQSAKASFRQKEAAHRANVGRWARLSSQALLSSKASFRQKVVTYRKNADSWARMAGAAVQEAVKSLRHWARVIKAKRRAAASKIKRTRKLWRLISLDQVMSNRWRIRKLWRLFWLEHVISKRQRIRKEWRRIMLHAVFANQQMVQLLWAKMAILAFRTAEFTQEMTEDERRGTIQWDALPAEKKTDTARARMRICTRSWLFMQESNLQDVENPTFKRESLAMQKFPAKIKNFFLELFDIIHQTTQQRKIALSHVSETVYAAVVRDVVELKLGGLATVNDTWTALIFYIPGYDKDKVQIGFKMATITMLVNIYEETSDKVVTLYEQYFPESMNTARKEHIQKSQEKRTQSLTLLKDQLKLAFGRRFHIGGFEESEKGLPLIVIETRMVFPDGREIFTKKWRTVCTVYEALEKLYSQVFYHMFHGQVLEAEAKLGVQYNLTGIFLDAGGDA